MKTLLIFSYIVGTLFTYGYAKYYRDRTNQNTWVDVAITFLFAMFSWVGLLMLKCIKDHTVSGKRYLTNPPKFL